MPIRNPTAPINGMARHVSSSEEHRIASPRFTTKCAHCGDIIRKWERSLYFPKRDLFSHLACSVPDFEFGYFLRLGGDVYEVMGRCLRCDDLVYAKSWVFSSAGGETLFHFDCALPLVRGSFDPDADLRGYIYLPQRSPRRVA